VYVNADIGYGSLLKEDVSWSSTKAKKKKIDIVNKSKFARPSV